MADPIAVPTTSGIDYEEFHETDVPGLVITAWIRGRFLESDDYLDFVAITHRHTGFAIFNKCPVAIAYKALAVLGNCGKDWNVADVNEAQDLSMLPVELKDWIKNGQQIWGQRPQAEKNHG